LIGGMDRSIEHHTEICRNYTPENYEIKHRTRAVGKIPAPDPLPVTEIKIGHFPLASPFSVSGATSLREGVIATVLSTMQQIYTC